VATFTALYDACVLYPITVRDLLMQLATTNLFRARWTREIQDEWVRNLLNRQPALDKAKLARTQALMNSAVRDCLIEGYEPLIDSIKLPDPADRHVVAAAIKAGADVIVTYNLKDFPEEALTPHGLEARHPDKFLTHTLDLSQGVVCEAVKRCRVRSKNPPYAVDEYLTLLEKRELTQFVSGLREFAELL
jgi:predicted nucleic acid-binding protein